jgi:glycosyltransferase involved in cell wall biosynthesis
MMRSAIASILETERPDVIHVETFYVLQNVPQTRVPIVCIEHNIEWSVYDKHASRAPFFLRPLLWWDARKIEREERNAWKRSRAVVAVSEYEKSQIDADQVGYAPNGFSPEDFPYVDPTHKSTNAPTVLFMGNFKWVQNRDACAYLLTRLWPRVKKKWKNTYPLKLWIVGKHIPASIRQLYTQDDVVYDEHAPDKTSDIYLRSTVLLSPLFVGGGSSYKIIEAMASGVPVVTTPLGMQGLGAKENVHMLVGDNPDTLADHVVTLLTHPEVYTSVSKQAKRFIHAHFSWKEIAKSLQAVYKQVGDTN